jgi:hypothetical protein
MEQGQSAEDLNLVDDDIPEDPLQRTNVQDPSDLQEPPEEEDHFFDDLVSHIPKKTTEDPDVSNDLMSVENEMRTVEDPYDHFGEKEEDIEK